MPPTPRVATLARVLAPPPPDITAPPLEVEKVVDDEKEERLYFIVQLLGACREDSYIVREVMRAFAVPREQALDDCKDARDTLRARLDDEGTIDAVAYSALAMLQVTRQTFSELAFKPIPNQVRELPGSDADDPEKGAIYRKLSPSEEATLVTARATAAKVAIAANEALLKIAGRRSTRWAEKPQNVIVAVGGEGLSEDDKKLLQNLGMR